MVQGDQAGPSNQGGAGGGKRKNKNRNRNRNKNRQATATENQQPTQAEPSAQVTEEPPISNLSSPISLPPLSTETPDIAAQHQLPIFDSSIGTFRPVTNTFLPSYATVSEKNVATEDVFPDDLMNPGNLSSDDGAVPEKALESISNEVEETYKKSDEMDSSLTKNEEQGVEEEIVKKSKDLDDKICEIERQNKLIDNLTVELKTRPDITNWPTIRDAERNYVNAQIQQKRGEGGINGVDTSDDSVENLVKSRLKQPNSRLRQTNPTLRQKNSTLRQREWSSGDDEELEKKKQLFNDKKAELIQNMKMEISNNPYMASWAQITDAENRLLSKNKIAPGDPPKRGQVKPSKGNKHKKVEESSVDSLPVKKEEKADSDSDVDLFASSEEDEKPKPKMVAPKPKTSSSNTSKNKKTVEKKSQDCKAPENPVKKNDDKKETSAPSQAPSTSSLDTQKSALYHDPSNGERSFIMLKPDAVHRGLVGQIISRFEKKGFKLVALKVVQATQDLLKRHYSDLSKKPFFPELIRYMTSGPVVPMVWEGLHVVKTGRLMLGETNPRDSKPGTIRGDFCIDVGRNICHGSDSVESAVKEIEMWFGCVELTSWRPVAIPWIYEDEETEPAQELKHGIQEQKSDKKNVDNLGAMAGNEELLKKVSTLEIENKSLKKVTDDLKNLVLKLENRVSQLEKGSTGSTPAAAKPAPAKVEEEDDDDVDLFGDSDSEDEDAKAEKERITQERLKAYHEKKSKKPTLIAKTSVLLDIKPWDDETDMKEILKAAKSITKDGLLWGASKLVPVGYGINKWQLMCVVEDEKVSIDELCEQICEFEDFVQSCDVASMSKI